ncbi:MAG: hypothetical protein R3B13_37355 [Polyangiaceae bacterium]
MVWVRGGRVGYLPRDDALHWQPRVIALQQRSGLPVACNAHVELPPEESRETSLQVVLWLPRLPWHVRPAWGPHEIARFLELAQHEPARRAERKRIREEGRRVAQEDRARSLMERFGADTAGRILAEELWLGATEEMVEATFGRPDRVEEKVLKTKTKRVFNYTRECPKCDGAGSILEFAHINDGLCFGCKGTGRTNSYLLKVRFENGAVVGWDKK